MMEPPSDIVRPAGAADLPEVRRCLDQAIDTSPYYSARFKAYEKARLNDAVLRTLISIDPWHIALTTRDGELAGFVITMPDLGNLWSPWVYIAPEFRSAALGLSLIRFMIRHWDHGRFHKISCYVRPDNRAASTIFRRFGFTEIAVLKTHLFGEDFILMERPLDKAVEGYDDGVRVSRLRLLRIRLGDALGRT